MFHIQLVSGDTDITSDFYAELDADEARIWDESGDLILVLVPSGDDWVVERCDESFGQGTEWWIGTEYLTVEDALEDVKVYADQCF